MYITMTIKPASLNTGDLIGVMAPSSVIDKGELDAGLKLLEQRGYEVYVHPQTYAIDASAAGTNDEKIIALHDLFGRSDVKAIFAANGGNHSLFLLNDKIDYSIIRRNPKIFMGFSDTTALLNAYNARASLTTFHGPLVKWMPTIKNIDLTFEMLGGEKITYPANTMNVVKTGLGTGPLIGGNLTILHFLMGTKFMPKLDGAILFIEDVGEEFSNLDRLFWKLRVCGVLEKISGLVIGQITKSKDTGRRPYGFTLEEIIEKHIGGLTIPIVSNAPFGHDDLLAALPIGGLAKLSVRRNTISFGLTEPAVRV